ncbi:MAG: pseudouridine synthase, partial [Candidatus Bipolaricaulia bacterium]
VKLVQQQAGVSRRKAEGYIKDGRVDVNGQTVTNPFVEFSHDEIDDLKLKGQPIPLERPERVVKKFHKPRGMLSSHHDPHHKNTVGQVLKRHGLGDCAITGRLDQDAEGLLVVTNDGDLVNVLTHPSYEAQKTYRVTVPRALPKRHADEVLGRMKAGVQDEGEPLHIEDGWLAPGSPNPDVTELELILAEGRKHEIKRLFRHVKLPVSRILRTAIGPVQLGDLRPNGLASLSPAELDALRQLKRRRPSTD